MPSLRDIAARPAKAPATGHSQGRRRAQIAAAIAGSANAPRYTVLSACMT